MRNTVVDETVMTIMVMDEEMNTTKKPLSSRAVF
jgi:hypothetical protein